MKARGYLREVKGEIKFTNAGILLFGKNPSIYFPCSRLRVIKFEGNDFQIGTSMNIIKEKTFDKNLYKILNEAKEFINSQLREFSYLNKDGVFEKHLEYPEFVWYEGIVNAVTHRLSEASDKLCYEKKNIMRSWTKEVFFYGLFYSFNFS